MIIRLSHKLARKIKVGTLVEMSLDENQYADWSANIFSVKRTSYVMLSNTKSLYSCVMYAKGINNDNTFIQRSLSLVREFMEDDGKEGVYEEHIIPSTASVTFAKSLNRSVIGSMNELMMSATSVLEGEDIAPHNVGTFLNDVLLSESAREGDHGYGKPREAFEHLMNRAQ